MKLIPENIRRCMSPEDRKTYSQLTNAEIAARNDSKSELALHGQFISFLRRNSLGYYHADPTRKSTIKSGMPDFGIYDQSRILWIEFKVGKNDLSPVQRTQIETMISRRNLVFVVRDLKSAVEITKKFFNLPV